MSNANIRMIDRQFELTGKADRKQLRENIGVLIQTLQKMGLPDSSDTQLAEDYAEIMSLLKTGSFAGNEAGAAQYTGFAATEIEEALRRMERGEHFAYLRYRHHWHKYPHSLVVRDFPMHLGIESSSVCGLRCKMYSQSDPEFRCQKSNFGFMDYELYQRIIDEGAARGLCSAIHDDELTYSQRVRHAINAILHCDSDSIYSYLGEPVINIKNKANVIDF